MVFEIITRKSIYKGKIFEVVEDETRLPNGKTATYSKVLHNGAAAIIPVAEDGSIYLVRQFRPAPGIEALELPAGKLELGELPLDCASRELEEEIGLRSDSISFLIKFYSAIGFCDEMLHIYVAKNLAQSVQRLDEDEFVSIEKYSLDAVVELIMTGKIIDSKTIAGILAYKQTLA